MFIRPFCRIKYIGRENIPQKGKLLICSNHISYFDPVAIGMGVRRKIYFIAKSEFFTDYGFFVRNFFRICGVLPINRNSSDIRAVGTAEEYLAKGRQIGIFPQGRIEQDRKVFSPKAGAALLSVRTGTPVIPVSIYTKGKIRPFCRITVRFGKVLEPPEDSSLKAARQFSLQIQKQIISQLEEEHQ